jgi:hypothetical protein
MKEAKTVRGAVFFNQPLKHIRNSLLKSIVCTDKALSQWRCACWRTAMVRCLLIGVGEFDHVAIVVGTPQEGDSRREVVSCETRGDDDGRDEDKKRIDMRRALLINEGWIHAVLDQSWLMLDRLVHDGVELVVRHNLEDLDRQFFASQEILIMCGRGRGSCPSLA